MRRLRTRPPSLGSNLAGRSKRSRSFCSNYLSSQPILKLTRPTLMSSPCLLRSGINSSFSVACVSRSILPLACHISSFSISSSLRFSLVLAIIRARVYHASLRAVFSFSSGHFHKQVGGKFRSVTLQQTEKYAMSWGQTIGSATSAPMSILALSRLLSRLLS